MATDSLGLDMDALTASLSTSFAVSEHEGRSSNRPLFPRLYCVDGKLATVMKCSTGFVMLQGLQLLRTRKEVIKLRKSFIVIKLKLNICVV